MLHTFAHHRTRFVLPSIAAIIIGVSSLTLRAAPPSAPGNLVASVNGLFVTLAWEPSSNSPTEYILQAGFAPGETAIQVALGPGATSFNGTAGPGTYYVRVVARNSDGISAPSNEVTVVLSTGCVAPSRPLNLRAIVRGTEAFVFWRQPLSGRVGGYLLQAGTAPGQTFTQFTTPVPALNANVASGTYFVRVIATSPCGNSPASNEIELSFPSNTVRVADPEAGTTLGLPDVSQLIARFNAEQPGLISQSCPTGRKYEPNPWLNYIVDRLRQYDTRFGYNAKPTRTSVDNNGFPVIAAGDEIAFFAGSGVGQGSPATYGIDVLFDHCGTRPELTYRDIAPEPVVWTGAGRFSGDEKN
jgi:hypothetical protein